MLFTNEKQSWRDSPHMIEVIIKSYLSQVLMANLHQLIWSWLIWGIFAPGFPMSRSQTSVCHQAFLHHWYSLSLKVILVATCTVYSVLNPGSCPESSKYPLKKKTVTLCIPLLQYAFGIQGIQQPSHSKCLEMTSSCRVRHEHYLDQHFCKGKGGGIHIKVPSLKINQELYVMYGCIWYYDIYIYIYT